MGKVLPMGIPILRFSGEFLEPLPTYHTSKEEGRQLLHELPQAVHVRDEGDVPLQNHLVVPEAVGPCNNIKPSSVWR